MNAGVTRSKQGFTLAVAMFYVAIISTVFASVISLVLTEYRITKNSTARLQALYFAEAGVDLALHEFNKEARGTAAWAGWTKDGGSYRLQSAPDILLRESGLKPELSVTADTATLKIVASCRLPSASRTPPAFRNLEIILKRDGQTCTIHRWEEK